MTIMYSQISSRLLYYCAVKSNFRSISKAGIFSQVSLTKCNLLNSTIRQSQEEAHKLEYKSNADKDSCSISESGHYDEEVDEFVDENDQLEAMIDYEAITGNDPQKIEALKMVLQDRQVLRDQGYRFIPDYVAPCNWQELMNCSTFDERKNCFTHLFIIENRNAVMMKKKTKRKQNHREIPKEPRTKLTTSSPLEYKLGGNVLFHRVYKGYMSHLLNCRLVKAEWFGPHLIIDCGYQSYMNMKEIHHCGTQLIQSWLENRLDRNPFDIIFCNITEDSPVYEKFHRMIPNVVTRLNPVNFTSKHYTDLFPPEKLIYLSPHSDHVMEEYEPDCVYIVGAFVDEIVHDPVSMERAKRDGLRTAKFPIDKYLNWCQGSQFLPLNQCVKIMNRLKNGRPWEEALTCIAKRKLNYVGLNFNKEPKVDLKSTRHMWAMYSYEMGKDPDKRAPTEV